MRLLFVASGWSDYTRWSADQKMLRRINALIDDMLRDPYAGIGKPEPLEHQLAGYWSRRITQEHRIVYKVAGNSLVIVQIGTHYRG